MEEREKFLAASVVAGILASDRTGTPRWDETAAAQALALVDQVESLLIARRQETQKEHNLTEESLAHSQVTGRSADNSESFSIIPLPSQPISFTELTKLLDPLNRERKGRREKTFREYLTYEMTKAVPKTAGEEEFLIDQEGKAPSKGMISTEIDSLKSTKFDPPRTREIAANFLKFLQASDSTPHKNLFDHFSNSRKKSLVRPRKKSAKKVAKKVSNSQRSSGKKKS